MLAAYVILAVITIFIALYTGTVIGAARAEGISAGAALRYEARMLRREYAAAARTVIRAVIDSGRRIITSRAARRLDAARRRSAAVTFEQARAACVLADAGVLPTRNVRRPSRRRPLVRAAMTCAAAAAAAVLLAAPLVSSLAGADVRAAAASIVRQVRR